MRAGAKTKTATALISKETTEMNLTAKPSRRHRSGLIAALIAAVALLAAAFAAPAQGAFGIHGFDVTYTNEDGTPATQAGSHPFALTTVFYNNVTEVEPFNFEIDGFFKDLFIEQVRGLTGDATLPRCAASDFAQFNYEGYLGNTVCPSDTVVGLDAVAFEPVEPFGLWTQAPVYNLAPPPGAAARLGFWVLSVPVTVDVTLKPGGEYNVVAKLVNAPEVIETFGAALQLWGVPADPGHDSRRGGECGGNILFGFGSFPGFGPGEVSNCPTTAPERPLLTLPRNCSGPAAVNWEADSWEEPGKWLFGSSISHDNATPPNLQGFTGCGKLPFTPTTETDVGTGSAETGTGIDFSVDFNQEGIQSPDGLAQSEARKAVVTLPEGLTINPSVAEGLSVCTPSDIDRETLASAPGEGCPNGSKLGDIQIDTPLVDEGIEGSIFLAQQDDPGTTTPGAENPFDSLIALYMVLKNPSLGVLVKLPMKVEPDPKTGQLVATLDDIPQVPFSHFNFHFKEGQRAPLVTPAACGTYTTKATFYPWANPSQPRTSLSSFEITSGLRGGACPPGGLPPFKPHFEAGSINNDAGAHSPFNMRLVREDGEQDMTKFSSTLPPGVLGSLAGVSKCPDAAVDVAKAKTARQELASPSCPVNSLIGHSLAGAGVGSALTYVPGQIYLGGPYKGDPLSVISITPALAGPFDAGTVVVRLALTLNPKTAEVEVDGANSDPIPHIVKGIVLKVRDLRVYVDRPNFTLNPTDCDESSAKATLFGSFLDVFNPADDVPAPLSTRYQAANCLNLGFKPKLALNLKGGTKRGGHPGLSAIFTPRPGDANVEGLVVRLPRSAFLDQAHIRTICTRVQFAADSCPPAAQYGYIKAWTPLLDEPLQGPVWLRSSDHKLPDLVFDLHGLVDIEVATRIDSAKGGIRASLEDLPDAPLSKVVLRMQGAKKGLIINSRDLCARKSRADVQLSGQNGKRYSLAPVMRAQCGGKRKRSR
jgi:hypothetical protein